MRATSLEAYKYITETGILGRDRTRCYEIMFHFGPLAQFQLEAFEGHKLNRGSLPKRVSELREMGLLHVVGRKRNPSSDRQCELYDVTSRMPEGGYRRPTKAIRCSECGRPMKPVPAPARGQLDLELS